MLTKGILSLSVAVFGVLLSVAMAGAQARDCREICKDMQTAEQQKCAGSLNTCFDACGRPADRTCGQGCFNEESLCRYRVTTIFVKDCIDICNSTPQQP